MNFVPIPGAVSQKFRSSVFTKYTSLRINLPPESFCEMEPLVHDRSLWGLLKYTNSLSYACYCFRAVMTTAEMADMLRERPLLINSFVRKYIDLDGEYIYTRTHLYFNKPCSLSIPVYNRRSVLR